MPPNDIVLAGSAYRISMVYAGQKTLSRNNQKVLTDQINCAVSGPDVRSTLLKSCSPETPRARRCSMRCPFSLGTFSLELVR